MNTRKAVACAFSLLATGVLAACGSGITQPPATESPAAKPEHTRSWMSPGAKRRDLLYVSDVSTGDVYVYSWPKGTLEGTLTGFGQPNGECVDKAGDVWIADYAARNVVEYAHGGTGLIATLSDTYGYPIGCAVDKESGNLAVTNRIDEVSGYQGQGGVLIYPRASGSPTQYQDPGIYFYDFCAYDKRGNLYLDGINNPSDDQFAFAELPKGASTFTNITLSHYINYPGGIALHGGHVDVLDELSSPSTIYEFSISGSEGSLQGSTPLNGANAGGSDLTWANEFVIYGTKVVAPIYAANQPPSGSSSIDIYGYPAGGNPVKSISANSRIVGAAISKAKS